MARKILLADDSVTAQNMGRRILSDAGYEVITVNNGSAALKKIAESKPDLIILDVYMPGYGGLEVCQRLKEAQETARIPVLLSVGKLEPFKVEESRRVRADGFIIKPFEASELLTALTKLEDKIVPQAESFKPGRFARAIASAEQLSTSSAAVGEESGWKSRLTIPAATPKPEEVETPESQPASAGLRETAQREESKSIAMKSAEVTAALPQGITAEELAALAAAASAFAGKNETAATKTEEPEVPTVEKIESQEKAESLSVEIAEAVTFASAPPVQEEARKELQTPAQAAEMQRATTDAEVLAALASLSPTHIASAAPFEESAGSNGDHSSAHRQEERAAGETGASGPRWIAQSVAIAEDESTLVLEREMEKAYAAMAALAAEKEQASLAAAESNAPIVAEAVTNTESASMTETSSSARSTEVETSQQAQPAAPIPVAEAQTPAVAEIVPEVSSPEAAAAEISSPAPENVNAVSETSVPVASENAAYAAAASAGSGVSEQVEASPNVEASVPAENIAPPMEAVPERESELAAAWQNWKQIRESILGSQLPKDVAHAAAGLEQMPKHDPDVAQPAAEASSESGPSESAAIANIVDSVLAELKPKLMEEISKKMKKDKKK